MSGEEARKKERVGVSVSTRAFFSLSLLFCVLVALREYFFFF